MTTTQNQIIRVLGASCGIALGFCTTLKLSAATLYVSLASTNPVAPYSTWTTAATNIQDAVDAAQTWDTVLVTNGVYAARAREAFVLETNTLTSAGFSRVVVTNAIKLESIHGPSVTTIDGGKTTDDSGLLSGIRCVYLGNGSLLSGFTLANGVAGRLGASPPATPAEDGGGLLAEPSATVTNCEVVSNFALNSGGGACGGTLYRCLLRSNVVRWESVPGEVQEPGGGGGAYGSTLYQCQLVGNSVVAASGSARGGGAANCVLIGCNIASNSASPGACAPSPCPGSGGAAGSTLLNSVLTENSGLGAQSSTLINCVLTMNSGGAANSSTLFSCTLVNNVGYTDFGPVAPAVWSPSFYCNCILAGNSPQYYANDSLRYCLTSPLPTNGVDNIAGAPRFMDAAGGNFRLQSGSPGIDAGANLKGFSITVTNWQGNAFAIAYPHEPTDILGNSRFIDGNGDGAVAWDLGAYEFNSFKPPRFRHPPQPIAQGWKLLVTGEPNQSVHVQKSGDLNDWVNVWTGALSAEGLKEVTDAETGQNVKFYRAFVP